MKLVLFAALACGLVGQELQTEIRWSGEHTKFLSGIKPMTRYPVPGVDLDSYEDTRDTCWMSDHWTRTPDGWCHLLVNQLTGETWPPSRPMWWMGVYAPAKKWTKRVTYLEGGSGSSGYRQCEPVGSDEFICDTYSGLFFVNSESGQVRFLGEIAPKPNPWRIHPVKVAQDEEGK